MSPSALSSASYSLDCGVLGYGNIALGSVLLMFQMKGMHLLVWGDYDVEGKL